MPCNTLTEAQVELGKCEPTLLAEAMKQLGVQNYLHNAKTGTLTMSGNRQPTLAEVKVAYSRQVVQSQARRYGWKITETAPNRFEVRR